MVMPGRNEDSAYLDIGVNYIPGHKALAASTVSFIIWTRFCRAFMAEIFLSIFNDPFA